jgi:hypothetical protein
MENEAPLGRQQVGRGRQGKAWTGGFEIAVGIDMTLQ